VGTVRIAKRHCVLCASLTGRFLNMSHQKPPIDRYARATVETIDEYAKHRIKNCEDIDRLNAIQDEEVKIGPRQNRIAWINQTKAELD